MQHCTEDRHIAISPVMLRSSNVRTDEGGRTPLWYAAEHGDHRIVQMLLEAGAGGGGGAPLEEQPPKEGEQQPTEKEEGHQEKKQEEEEGQHEQEEQQEPDPLLVADAISRADRDGRTPLMMGCISGDYNVVRSLLGEHRTLYMT